MSAARDASTPDHEPVALDELVDRLGRIPDSSRVFGVPAARATDRYQIPAQLMEQLREAGLPRRYDRGVEMVNHHDLVNIGLELQLPSAQVLGMRHWRDGLLRPRAAVETWRIGYCYGCPRRGHPGSCHVDVLTPDAGRVREEFERPRPMNKLAHVSRVTLREQWPDLPARVLELTAQAERWTFTVLPWELAHDPQFARTTGLADCTMAARLLVTDAARRGIAARFAMGLAVVAPFSMRHCWSEFLIEDVWVPTDPLMTTALRRWGLLRRAWAPQRSIGAMLTRLAAEDVPQATHNEQYLRMSMPTSLDP